jgi:hypothetical protein
MERPIASAKSYNRTTNGQPIQEGRAERRGDTCRQYTPKVGAITWANRTRRRLSPFSGAASRAFMEGARWWPALKPYFAR